ncbi:MAG: peptidoglycan D,D-transpeptidase FtsI family protein [Sphingomonadaceae bacterium]
MTALVARPTRERFGGQREQSVALVHFRLMVVMLMFVGVTLVIGGRLAYLTIFSDRAAAGNAASSLIPPRANLTDRNGVVLAGTIDAWKIGVHPKKIIGDRNHIAAELARLMPNRSEAQYRSILNSDRNFYYLKHEALPSLVRKVNALGEPGIVFEREPRRYYPQGSLAAHVIGWTDQDGKAVTGMELALDEQLSDQARLDRPVALSIDSRVQAAMESELRAAMVTYSAIGATGIVLDVDTGEVVAMASLPDYDPNAPSRAPVENLASKVTLNVYELGSTFKMITAAAAIEDGVVHSMTQRWDATAPLQVGRYTIRDDHPTKRWLNLPELIAHSSNIGTARIADELGPQRMAAMFRKVGFDKPVDIELGARGTPLWPKYWARVTTMTVAYGHGIAVTPLHLANAYAAIVNGGIWRPATLVRRDADHIPGGRQVVSPATSARMRQLMRLVAVHGTARKADVPGFRVGGKTGTAEKPFEGGYKRNALVSTFAGVFPMDAPRYVVIAMLDEPKGTRETGGYATAGQVAAPSVGRIINRIGPLLGVIPDDTRDVDMSDLQDAIQILKTEKP